MRHALALVLAALLSSGCEPFHEVQKQDDIAAYEAYLADHPGSRFDLQARTRLEELYLAKADEAKTLEGYDDYLTRFSDGIYREKAMTKREDFLFSRARDVDSLAAWEQFLAEYPNADKKRKKAARQAIEVAGYREHLALGEARRKRINLAEQKDGPLDGWQFDVDVTNNGPKTITYLSLWVQWDRPGQVAGRDEWPVVSERWPIPMEEEKKAPIKPGQTRTWTWTTRDVPEDYDGPVKITPSAINFADAK